MKQKTRNDYIRFLGTDALFNKLIEIDKRAALLFLVGSQDIHNFIQEQINKEFFNPHELALESLNKEFRAFKKISLSEKSKTSFLSAVCQLVKMYILAYEGSFNTRPAKLLSCILILSDLIDMFLMFNKDAANNSCVLEIQNFISIRKEIILIRSKKASLDILKKDDFINNLPASFTSLFHYEDNIPILLDFLRNENYVDANFEWIERKKEKSVLFGLVDALFESSVIIKGDNHTITLFGKIFHLKFTKAALTHTPHKRGDSKNNFTVVFSSLFKNLEADGYQVRTL